ncbi:hypothetical protein DTO96_102028 [Ephemeroptericola cinctiostellae]|uniref:RNA-directed DNA polymerase n=1 Tax=Ephemeroptericola cinctiostellae TaxID=2268024 RepID=A0A345DD44_9BURK|nr:retron Ec67 family RNA-directed DNA polymerase/endonuclease [Ephemeroptericola cinctiostellae]AXF86282.1 hypothetical protein DTO96_102028 [Ephemeroptericola cinctiostellae]
MTLLEQLRQARTLSDFAIILGYEPKKLSYLLYILPKEKPLYNQFSIKKRSGGERVISAPCEELKELQKRLLNLLDKCSQEINASKSKNHNSISHGFKKRHSIVTNAVKHKNKQYVFNIDLENFFGTINFQRVCGFFVKSREFQLHSKIAEIIALISCHQGSLPQGAATSPIISNLITHILDVRLVKFSTKIGVFYSRYADDLTFSTNKKNFPIEAALKSIELKHQWIIGKDLNEIINRSGFKVNSSKTRMQYKNSRQEVTGLIVNKKINTKREYKQKVRAMVHALVHRGEFNIFESDSGMYVKGSLNQLRGMLSFIESINPRDGCSKANEKMIGRDIYHKFLFYKYFYFGDKPILICEGKTDGVYIREAIKWFSGRDEFKGLKFDIFKYSKLNGRVLGLNGGYSDLTKFIAQYLTFFNVNTAPSSNMPVIVVIDNDDAAKKILKDERNENRDFYHKVKNLYVVTTPLVGTEVESEIEDLFKIEALRIELNGKTFHKEKDLNDGKHYGKHVFSEKIVKSKEYNIDFSGFEELLKRIQNAIKHFETQTNENRKSSIEPIN